MRYEKVTTKQPGEGQYRLALGLATKPEHAAAGGVRETLIPEATINHEVGSSKKINLWVL
jgi:hypothetical protein